MQVAACCVLWAPKARTLLVLLQASAKGVPPSLPELRHTVASQLQPPAGFQEELAAQAEEGGLISSGDWSQSSDKWAHAWSAICQVGVEVSRMHVVCVCVSVCLFICLSVCQSLYLCVCLSACVHTHVSVYLCTYMAAMLYLHVFMSAPMLCVAISQCQPPGAAQLSPLNACQQRFVHACRCGRPSGTTGHG